MRTGKDRVEVAEVGGPVTVGGVEVASGDLLVGDDDGVVVVPRRKAAEVLEASRIRAENEEVARARYRAGELSLDTQGMREALAAKGLTYLDRPPEP